MAKLYNLAAMTEEERLAKLYEIRCVRVHSLVECDLGCRFCSTAAMRRQASGSSKPTIVNLSTAALRNTLLAVKAQVPNVMTIYDSSDEVWLGRGRGEAYCRVLEEIKSTMDKGLPRGMRYLIQCRSTDLTEELVDLAARVGIKHLTLGVESPVAQVRKDMRKPQDEGLIRNAIQWCVSRGIDAYLLGILFFPTVTLEQLHETVAGWHDYQALGATISIEPYTMSYLGTPLHDDPSFLVEFVGYEIPFSGIPMRRLKWESLIWPRDHRVCAVLQWFRKNVDRFINEGLKRLGHHHGFKGASGAFTIDCLEYALKLYAQGSLPPWEPGANAKRSEVYQEYGGGTRFNSTHRLLDEEAAK